MNKFLNLSKKFFKIHRSISGYGVRKTLKIIKREIPKLKIKSFKSRKKVFDWKIPDEWNIQDAFIKDHNGKKIVDFKKNNLAIVNYSIPIKKTLSKNELFKHLYTLKKKPNSVPYVTSYYKKNWGFCLKHKDLKKFKSDKFLVEIRSSFKKNGKLNYGELIIKGKSKKEILISTYICHPAMANNETSGPAVTTMLAKYFSTKNNYFTKRIIFIPETIGSISYINMNLEKLKKNIIGGYVITCVGDERRYSYLQSKYGNSLSDYAAISTMNKQKIKFIKYNFLDRGSDERQFNSPKVDLTIGSVMRSKYGTYPEYHTSDDNYNLVTNKGLNDSYNLIKKIILNFDKFIIPLSKIICEPHLSKRKLYPSISSGNIGKYHRNIINFLNYSDGKNNLKMISNLIKIDIKEVKKIYNKLLKNKLIIKL